MVYKTFKTKKTINETKDSVYWDDSLSNLSFVGRISDSVIRYERVILSGYANSTYKYNPLPLGSVVVNHRFRCYRPSTRLRCCT